MGRRSLARLAVLIQKKDTRRPTLLSWTVAEDGNTSTLVFSEAVTVSVNAGFLMSREGGSVQLGNTSGSGTSTLVFDNDAQVLAAEVLTGSFAPPPGEILDASLNRLSPFSGFAVTNNSTIE